MCIGEAAEEESSRSEGRDEAERDAGGRNKVCVGITVGECGGGGGNAGRCLASKELFGI